MTVTSRLGDRSNGFGTHFKQEWAGTLEGTQVPLAWAHMEVGLYPEASGGFKVILRCLRQSNPSNDKIGNCEWLSLIDALWLFLQYLLINAERYQWCGTLESPLCSLSS